MRLIDRERVMNLLQMLGLSKLLDQLAKVKTV